MTKMNPAIKAKWVAALRSGEYRQGEKRVLSDGSGGWCCLGVLCDIYAKESGKSWEPFGAGMRLTVGSGTAFYPPQAVREWASFHEDAQPVEMGGHLESVAVHNDGISCARKSFTALAAAIEDQL